MFNPATVEGFREPLVSCRPAAPHSSRGLGHRPLKAEITGSNPVCGTNFSETTVCALGSAWAPGLVFVSDLVLASPIGRPRPIGGNSCGKVGPALRPSQVRPVASSSPSKSLPADPIGRVRGDPRDRTVSRSVFPSGLPAWSYPASRGSARLSCGVMVVRLAETTRPAHARRAATGSGRDNSSWAGWRTSSARYRTVDSPSFRRCSATALDIALLRAAPADPGRWASSTAHRRRARPVGRTPVAHSIPGA